MRRALPVFALALLALSGGCVDDPKPLIGGGRDPATTWPAATKCVESVRPTACTREYRPVCARSANGEQRTFSNGCEACLDASVVDHRPGACKVR